MLIPSLLVASVVGVAVGQGWRERRVAAESAGVFDLAELQRLGDIRPGQDNHLACCVWLLESSVGGDQCDDNPFFMKTICQQTCGVENCPFGADVDFDLRCQSNESDKKEARTSCLIVQSATASVKVTEAQAIAIPVADDITSPAATEAPDAELPEPIIQNGTLPQKDEASTDDGYGAPPPPPPPPPPAPTGYDGKELAAADDDVASPEEEAASVESPDEFVEEEDESSEEGSALPPHDPIYNYDDYPIYGKKRRSRVVLVRRTSLKRSEAKLKKGRRMLGLCANPIAEASNCAFMAMTYRQPGSGFVDSAGRQFRFPRGICLDARFLKVCPCACTDQFRRRNRLSSGRSSSRNQKK